MASPPDYVFTRDFMDNNRINLQHYLWIQIFGYLINPKIPTSGSDLRIADVGTGTGIWITDLAIKLPETVYLEGLDISFEATPPPGLLPRNLTLRHFDVKEDVPSYLLNHYDIINIRLFSLVLQDDDIEKVMDHLVSMLKPGGYLQWAEPDMSSFRVEKTNVDNKVEALPQLLRLTQTQDSRLKPTWVPKLPDFFSNAGLEAVESDVREAKPYLALAMHECGMMIPELIARKIKNKDVAQGIHELLPKCSEETRAGSFWAFTRWNVIGRKTAKK